MTNSATQRTASLPLVAVVAAILIPSLLVVFAVVPYANAYGVLEKEWEQVLQSFGEWPAKTTNEIIAWLNVQANLANWLGLNVEGSDTVSVALNNWFQTRIPTVEVVVSLIVLRVMVLLQGAAIFLPAGIVSLGCSLMQRKAQESRYVFTSPYKMTKMVQLFKLIVVALVLVLFSPTALPKEVLPVMMGLLALLGGWLVSGLHKEI